MASLESLLLVPPSLHTFTSPLNEQANQVTCFLLVFFLSLTNPQIRPKVEESAIDASR